MNIREWIRLRAALAREQDLAIERYRQHGAEQPLTLQYTAVGGSVNIAWDQVSTTVITSVAVTLITLALTKVIPTWWTGRKYAFALKDRIGPIWHLHKLRGPDATDFRYRIVMKDGKDRPQVLQHDTVTGGTGFWFWRKPGTGHGIWNLEPGDTLEIYWTENGMQFSTFEKIHHEAREYLLRRENTGH